MALTMTPAPVEAAVEPRSRSAAIEFTNSHDCTTWATSSAGLSQLSILQ